MSELFFEALQSYCAPVLTLGVFLVLLSRDRMLHKRTIRLFIIETLVILCIIAATWTDRVVSADLTTDIGWRIRTVTTLVNFALSPASPFLLMLIYMDSDDRKKQLFFSIPLICNALLCLESPRCGWIFSISALNEYQRGSLFFFPFAVSALYMIGMLFLSSAQKDKPDRRAETRQLLALFIIIAFSSILEVVFVKRFMLWSTSAACVILYYLQLTIQAIIFDPLTGALSRTALDREMGKRDTAQRDYAIAMLDLNDLKTFNDTMGHLAGDAALISVSSAIIRSRRRGMRLYRYGGDEFILMVYDNNREALEQVLNRAQKDCKSVENTAVTFAYGIAVRQEGESFDEVLSRADGEMYRAKQKYKSAKAAKEEGKDAVEYGV